ncbi:glutamyl-tRNA reductase [Aquaspirillum soli]|jgi:glutamyl-tRNA reductase
MHLLALGLNHQTAPLVVREKLAFPADTVPDALESLIATHTATEAVILSTCNRTEIYCNSRDIDAALNWLAHYHQLPRSEIEPYLYLLDAEAGARHAYRVACGLDSMVLGETQILGQLKDAVRVAENTGTLGTLLNHLFQNAFSVAKTVRSQTAVGASSVSMAAAAVRLAEQIFPSIQEVKVLFIGAGEMIELVATHYAAQHPAALCVANRTVARGLALAERFGGSAIALSDLPEHLPQYDVVVTSTASQLPILGKGMVERALRVRRHKPIFMLDLAVPRDIEAEVAELDDVFLYTVDDLASIVEAGRDARRQAAEQAEAIIVEHTHAFLDWLAAREVVPVVRALRDHGERVRRHAIAAAEKRLARGEDPRAVLEAFSQQLTNKLLHPPTAALNQARGESREQMLSLISRLYDLHPD